MNAPWPQIGSLTDRVQVQRRTVLPEPEGGSASVFVPLGNAWARVRSVAARQGESGDGRAVSVSHVVVLRFRVDMKPGDRIVYRGRPLEIVGAEDLNGRRAFLSCACSETAFWG